MEKFLLTTAIDYVNGVPHIGHAYEKIMCDVIVRHYRQRSREVFFLTGTDEHGVKIQKTAASLGVSPQELCDKNSQAFKDCWKMLDISYDKLIRTTDSEHKVAVQKIFKKLLDKGDIYKHSYKGLYCAGCECFLSERELDKDGNCPVHMKKPEEVEEENYFFKLTKYKDRIIELLKIDKKFIVPQFKVAEVVNQLETIEDISVSRSKSSVSWGIEVPDDPEQIVYVWIDALSNYITALGYDSEDDSKYQKYWGADVQVIGKDILKFHSIYWIAILMALEIPLPKSLLVHGWITIDETKMSKSVGNVIAPKNVFEEFDLTNADSLRYFLMTTAATGRDGNYSDKDFKEKVNADLANNIGNLLNRTLNMLVKYFEGEIKPEFATSKDGEIAKAAMQAVEGVTSCFNGYEVCEAAGHIVNFSNVVNKYVNDKAPWGMAKNGDLDGCANVLYDVLEAMRFIAVMLQPYCPNIAQDIYSQLGLAGNMEEVSYCDLKWGEIPLGVITTSEKIKPVFLRLDSELATDKKKG